MEIFRREFAKEVALPEVKPKDMLQLIAAMPDLIKQANIGLLDNEAFRNAIASKYGQKPVTFAAAQKIYAAAQEAQAKPEGDQRQTAYRRVYQQMEKEAGISGLNILRSWWYASVLSGMGTQGRNFFGNFGQTLDNGLAFSFREPKAIPHLIGAVMRGFRDNAMGEFGAVVKRGQETTGRAAEDIKDAGNTLENLADSTSLWKRMLSNGKYVSRFMAGVDSFFYAANAEQMATFMAYRDGKVNGLTGSEMTQYISNLLKLDRNSADWMNADAQARQESVSGLLTDKHEGTINRRRIEILRQMRPEDIQQEMKRMGLTATLNNTPEGFLGAIANYIIALRSKFPTITPVVPFVRISANVANMLLDHSPVGIARLYLRRQGTKNAFTPEEWQHLRAKVIISHAVGMALMTVAMSRIDDKDPDFQITGSFDMLSPQQRKQLEAQGIKPYQIRIGGLGLDYRQTPGALMFAMIGNWTDGVRYKNYDEKSFSVRVAAAMGAGHSVIIDQQFLSSLAGLMGRPVYGSEEYNLLQRSFRMAAHTAGGLVPSLGHPWGEGLVPCPGSPGLMNWPMPSLLARLSAALNLAWSLRT